MVEVLCFLSILGVYGLVLGWEENRIKRKVMHLARMKNKTVREISTITGVRVSRVRKILGSRESSC
jgi:hypothetical protein